MNFKKASAAVLTLSAAAILVSACKKPQPNKAPIPDTEVQPVVDATWATNVMSDIEMMASFLAEREYYSHFYVPVGSASITPNETPGAKSLFLSFNKTLCRDGHMRDGTIFVQYGNFTSAERQQFIPKQYPDELLDANYARSYGFGCFISLLDYRVDGVKIDTRNKSKLVLTSEVSSPGYDAAKERLTWRFRGSVDFIDPNNENDNMTWEGDLIKTCINSTNRDSVFKYTANHLNEGKIRWVASQITYHGKITGTTPGNRPYTFEIPADKPLLRNFRCYPNKVGNVALSATPGVLSVQAEEFHPFIGGVVDFRNVDAEGKTLYPRSVRFGNEGNLVSDVPVNDCDNVGEVYIKGISYSVNFRK